MRRSIGVMSHERISDIPDEQGIISDFAIARNEEVWLGVREGDCITGSGLSNIQM